MPSNSYAGLVTAREYADRKSFALGIVDARAGRPFRKSYETWGTQDQWCYETGRQLAQILPRDVPPLTARGKPHNRVISWLQNNIRDVK
jgi:hypothetical protein